MRVVMSYNIYQYLEFIEMTKLKYPSEFVVENSIKVKLVYLAKRVVVYDVNNDIITILNMDNLFYSEDEVLDRVVIFLTFVI